jgi:hypothetical protein
MDLHEEILARIKSAVSLDRKTTDKDFQIRVGETGSVLINMRTGRAQFLYDDDSPLRDIEDLGLMTIVPLRQKICR